jgi:hypothetical protein
MSTIELLQLLRNFLSPLENTTFEHTILPERRGKKQIDSPTKQYVMQETTLSPMRGKIEISISFSDELRELLHPALRNCRTIKRLTARHTSIKDLIESLRIPHTEIGSLTVNGRKVDFSYRLNHGDDIRVFSPAPGLDPCRSDLLRPVTLKDIRFLVDVNVVKLGTLLRMVGFDCAIPSHLDDAEIAETAVRQGRILLTRDRNLLKRKIVVHGHLVRNHLPKQQLYEILLLYGLQNKLRPYTRCMKCNTPLNRVNKADVLHRLEPLTKKYYEIFFYCHGCRSIYWSGSHKSGMDEILADIALQI